jgi:hypothetical protein
MLYEIRNYFRVWSLITFIIFDSTRLLSQSVSFTDVASEVGVSRDEAEANGHGVVFGDFNNDGRLDLYFVVNLGLDYFFIQRENGTFTDIADAAGTQDQTLEADRGVCCADFDNDGDLDVYECNGGKNHLFRNDGNLNFTDIASAAGVNNTDQGISATWGDYNRDGFLDLFVANWDGTYALYRNNGDATFIDVTLAVNMYDEGKSNIGVWFDYDNDGDQDIFVSREGATYDHRLWRNNGNGTFTNVASEAGLEKPQKGQGAAVADYDNDGFLDIYLASDVGANFLFHNKGNGQFEEVANQAGVADTRRSVGCAWGDFDNDGWMDLYVTNFCSANRLYFNNHDGTFTEHSGITADPACSYSITLGDFNNDGFLDIYHSNVEESSRLYKNSGNDNNWLQFQFIGVTSNRDGIGVRAEIYRSGLKQIQEVSGGSGYAGQNSLILHFGLADADHVDSLIVHWPSGTKQKMSNVQANQKLIIHENDIQYYQISGDVSYYSNSSAVPKVNISPGDIALTKTTDATGQYSLSLEGNKDYVVTPSKTANEDITSGTIVTYDAALVARQASGLISMNSSQRLAADVNRDGNIITYDAALIARYAVGLPQLSGSHVGEWIFVPENKTYNNICENKTNENYSAIILGDVDGNWRPASITLMKDPDIVTSDRLEKSVYIIADTLFCPFSISPNRDLLSFDLEIGYDEDQYQFAGVMKSSLANNLNFNINQQKNLIRLGAYGTDPINKSGVLFVLKLLHQGKTDLSANLELKRFQINNGDVEKSQLVLVNNKSCVPSSFQIYQNYPNPFNSSTTIRLYLPFEGNLKITVYNLAGRIVKEISNGYLKRGDHYFTWDGKNNQDISLSSGEYFFMAKFNDVVKSTKVLLLK